MILVWMCYEIFDQVISLIYCSAEAKDPTCFDKNDDCAGFGGEDMCRNYPAWASNNCQAYCDLCDKPVGKFSKAVSPACISIDMYWELSRQCKTLFE